MKLNTSSTGIDVTGNATFADNGKAIFGNASDLQIYHDGSNSYISEQGTGNLNVLGTSIEFLNSAANKYYLAMTDGGSLTAYHNGGAKLATTATGVDVTGTMTADEVRITKTSGSPTLHLTDNDTSGDGTIDASDGNLRFYSDNDGEVANSLMGFYVDGSEAMRIDSSTSVKIGFNNSNSYWNLIPVSGGAYAIMDHASGAGTGYSYYVFRYNGTTIGGISQNGTSGISYVTSSDYRLKENVTYDWDATTRLKQLKPARFNFIADSDTTVDGFLAHEAQAVVPESVTGTMDEVEVWKDGEELPDGVSVGDNKLDDDGNTIPVMQGIDQSKLVPLLVKTIQELEARIATLEAK
jgi:hypothetical protein